ncbi:sugar O-acyltransferase (sialic acid O-acetyltransferase NeuD family) [Pseudomonas hunanensis]|uniref:Sugar O-acyltransferase (Sialic acid O-acetyltransferase NeuD family) n=1 Tax=Pseudomonas hunanensis TaxID=1247546 RepID=A0ACC6K6V3_9PSED|nr:acetyltransferase [Pseudomonas hunanensis]MDR6714146.1 sugar O-acyltransferase (sialic acid O-acetyltransferase NeuD family) [Pseudomonas hunanensis]
MNRLAILGASGHGKVVADLAELCGWQQIDFFDDAWPGLSENGAWPVVGGGAQLLERLDHYQGVIVAIGNNAVRAQKMRELQQRGAPVPVLVHPSAVVSRHASLGRGTVVFAGAVVNAFATVGEGAILNTGSSVDHDCRIGDHVHVSPGARLAGGVGVGERSWIGIGAVVRQMIKIGCRATVGAGGVVVCDVADDTTVIGVPARPMARP